MEFAVNYSKPLIRLLTEDAVNIDLIKCPDWEGMLAEAAPFGPIIIHYDLEVGLGNTFKADFNRILDLKNRTATPHVNTHLVTPQYFDLNNHQEIKMINTRWRNEIQLMIEHLGAGVVALEHYPYTEATPHFRYPTDDEVFTKVINDTGCMLLLDLAHARITADTFGIDVKDYIRALPLDRLVEMHVTGIKSHSGVLTDHFGLNSGDWGLLEWALHEIKTGHWREPKVVAFEYGGVGNTFVWRTDDEVLKTQVPKLYEMIHG